MMNVLMAFTNTLGYQATPAPCFMGMASSRRNKTSPRWSPMRNGKGDGKVQLLDFGQQGAAKRTDCDHHPNIAEHMAMADMLVAAVKTALGR